MPLNEENENIVISEDGVLKMDFEAITTLAVVYAAAMGKLILMKEVDAFDDFWRDDIQEIINKSFELTPLVMEIFKAGEILHSVDSGEGQTKH